MVMELGVACDGSGIGYAQQGSLKAVLLTLHKVISLCFIRSMGICDKMHEKSCHPNATEGLPWIELDSQQIQNDTETLYVCRIHCQMSSKIELGKSRQRRKGLKDATQRCRPFHLCLDQFIHLFASSLITTERNKVLRTNRNSIT